jgi:hypothetical protein
MAMALLAGTAPAAPDQIAMVTMGLMLGQIVLLSLWLAFGAARLWQRAKQTAVAGIAGGVTLYVVFNPTQPSDGWVIAAAFWGMVGYLFASFGLAQQWVVGLGLAAVEIDVVRAGQRTTLRLREQAPAERVQFSILTLYRWMLLVACMLGLGRWLAAYPETCAITFGMLGALWGAATGVIALRQRLLPVPAAWKLLTLATGAFACGAALSLDPRALNAGLVFAVSAASCAGTLLVVRVFGYCLAFSTLQAALDRARELVLPEVSPDLAWLRGRDLSSGDPRVFLHHAEQCQ